MKKVVVLCSLVLLSCTKPENIQRMEVLLHGDWYGV